MREVKKFCPVKVIIPEGSDAQLIDFLDKLEVEYEFLPRHRDIKPARGLAQKIKMHAGKIRGEMSLLKFLNRYDLKNSVVHIELGPWQSLFALMYLCRRSGQVFVTMHNRIRSGSALRRALWKLKLRLITSFKNFHILASNKDARASLRSIAPGHFVDKIRVTSTGVNPPEIDEALYGSFDREAYGRKFGLPSGKFTVVCVGQFIDRKGRWTFLEAAQKLREAGEDIFFLWVSNSKPGEKDLAKIESYGLGDNFKLVTNAQVGSERRDLLRMYRLGDVFVLASFIEGLPIALLEAMALEGPERFNPGERNSRSDQAPGNRMADRTRRQPGVGGSNSCA